MNKVVRRKQKLRINLLVLLCCVVLFLFGSEIVFRIFLDKLDNRFNCDTDDLDCYLHQWDYYFNSQLVNYSIGKDPNVFRIAAVGDSFTAARGYDQESSISDISFSRQLEQFLNDNFRGKHYEVLNFGFPGANPLEEYWIIKESVLRYDPDMIIIQLSTNDIFSRGYNLNPIVYCDMNFSGRAKTRHYLYDNWKLLGFLNERLYEFRAGHEEFSMDDNPVGIGCFNSSLNRINDLLLEKKKEAVIFFIYDATYLNLNSVLESISFEYSPDRNLIARFDEIFNSTGMKFVHLYPHFIGIPPREVLAKDFYHYNRRGYEIMAKVMYDYLLENCLIPSCELQDCSLKLLKVEFDAK
jgi:hypothetical protein